MKRTNTKLFEKLKLPNKTYKFIYKDIKEMDIREVISYDKRSFFSYMWDLFKNKNQVYQIFFSKSQRKSRISNIMIFMLKFEILFTVNAIFYNDDDIEKQTKTKNANVSNKTFINC